MIKRKKTRPVRVGNIIIGGNFPISIQTMWKKPIHKINNKLVEELNSLKKIGCDILRISIPDMETADAVGKLADIVDLPLVADIHFDYRIALHVMDFNISKLRINPGNIGNEKKIEEIIKKAKDQEIPIRVGINAGSLPHDLRTKTSDTATAMLHAAERELEIFDKFSFNNIVFSLKASQIETTLQANRMFSEKYDFPLHIGLTEAGPMLQGTVKSTIVLSKLLEEGIGDTLRVSLSSEPSNEILVAKEIIASSTGIAKGVNIVSCPLCGRATFDVHSFLDKISPFLNTLNKNLTIAIMGCVVNGPGESKSADIGITGAGNYAVIFKRGKLIKKISIEDSIDIFKHEIENF